MTGPGEVVAESFVLRADAIYPRPSLGPASSVPALAVRGGRVVAAGSEAAARAAAGPAAPVIQLGRVAVLPGFVDAHIHLGKFALERRQLSIAHEASAEAVIAQVARKVDRAAPGSWILGRGWDHSRWQGWPNAAMLDGVSPEHPVALTRKDGHALWLNSRALAEAGITASSPSPEGGEIVKIDGEPSGVLKENAMRLLRSVIPRPDGTERRAALVDAWPVLWREGITGCHDMGYRGMALWDDLQALRETGDLGLRVVWYALAGALPELLARGLQQSRGDAWLRLGGLKLFLDGTLGSQTADMLEAYEGQPDNRGLCTLEQEAFCDLVLQAAEAGLPTAVHCIGDGANRKALDGFRSVSHRLGLSAGDLRHRIEHAQILHPDDIGRFASEGIVASMQPIHLAADLQVAEQFWGERCRHAYAWQSLLRSGARLAFGSDAPIESISVVEGLRCAVNRQDPDGRPPAGWWPEQALSPWQALAAYTEGAAWAAGLESELGSLEAGRWADLVVVEPDPGSLAPHDLGALQVRATMIEGRWVWNDRA